MKRWLPYITFLFSIISIALSGYLFLNSLITPVTPAKIACDKTDLLYLKTRLSSLSLGSHLADNYELVLDHLCLPDELRKAILDANRNFVEVGMFESSWRKENGKDKVPEKVLKKQFPNIEFVEKGGYLTPKSCVLYGELKDKFLESDPYAF